MTIQSLHELATQAAAASDEFTPYELANFLGFVDELEAIGNLLESRDGRRVMRQFPKRRALKPTLSPISLPIPRLSASASSLEPRSLWVCWSD